MRSETKMEHHRWYSVIGYRGHVGAGKNKEITIYIYAKDSIHAFNRYKKVPGVKRDPTPKYPFPVIKEVSGEEAKNLERRIFEDPRITVRQAKRSWYYPPNELY